MSIVTPNMIARSAPKMVMTPSPQIEASVVERFAYAYSDGSFGVIEPDVNIDKIREQQAFVDKNEKDPEHRTKICRVRLQVIEVLDTPEPTAPADIAALANAVLCENEGVHTPAQARLALALDAAGHRIHSREDCTCGESTTCDECPSRDSAIAGLMALAAKDQAVAPASGQ